MFSINSLVVVSLRVGVTVRMQVSMRVRVRVSNKRKSILFDHYIFKFSTFFFRHLSFDIFFNVFSFGLFTVNLGFIDLGSSNGKRTTALELLIKFCKKKPNLLIIHLEEVLEFCEKLLPKLITSIRRYFQ
jgi:hypothetical protein